MKRLLFLIILLLTIFFSISVIAQEMGSLRKGYEISFPEKIQQPVGQPLASGTYTIGTGGYFPTIDTAFNKLSIDGIAGPVTLELIDNLYTAPTNEYGFILNGPIPGAGTNSRVTIKPVTNKNVTLEGNGRFVINFWDISYLNFDGVSKSGSTTLTVHSTYNSQFDVNRCVGLFNNSDHNTIQNLILISEDIYRYGVPLVVAARQNSLFAPDSNLIQNNFIKKGGGSIYLTGLFAGGNVRPTGNIVRENLIGSETDSLINWGIQLEKCKNTIVENNIVQNLKIQNTVGEQVLIGINSHFGLGDTIRNNIVHNVKASGGDLSVGILLSGEVLKDGINNLVYNNMIYDIRSSSNQENSVINGIRILHQNDPKIYYNTVYLSGNRTGANYKGSAALYIYDACNNVDLRNNIFVNTRDETPFIAAAIYDHVTSNLTSDYNDLYCTPNQYNCLVRILDFKYNALAEWQATGKDLHSYVELPHFVEPYLHTDSTIATYLEASGTPIVGIYKDFDLQTRNILTPDIGADEFNGVPVGIEDEIPHLTEFSLAQNYPNPFNPTTKISYAIPQNSFVELKVFNLLGQEIATLVNQEKPAGNSEVNFNASNLPSGVYIYKMKAGEYVETRKMILLK